MATPRAWLPPTFISLALVAASLLLQYGLFEEFPPFPYYDEVYTVPVSRAIATAPETMVTDHPPLMPYLMSLSEAIFGDNPTGWRFPSRICGALTLPAVFLIGWLLTGNLVGATLGALALLCDGIFTTVTRAALLDPAFVFFGMYAVLVALWGTTRPSHHRSALYLAASGVLAGLSLSSKWSGIFFFAPIALIHLSSEHPARFTRQVRDLGLLFLVALTVYISITCSLRSLSPLELFTQSSEMLQRHVNFTQPHRYASSAWGWPLLARPIWFGYMPLPDLAPDGTALARGTICLGNPIVFLYTGLSMIILLALGLRDAVHRRMRLMIALPVCGYLACWTPWMLLSVRKGFLYYFYPSLCFACIGLGISSVYLFRDARYRTILCGILCALMLVGFIAYLPVYMGIPISTTQMKTLIAFDAWW